MRGAQPDADTVAIKHGERVFQSHAEAPNDLAFASALFGVLVLGEMRVPQPAASKS